MDHRQAIVYAWCQTRFICVWMLINGYTEQWCTKPTTQRHRSANMRSCGRPVDRKQTVGYS